MKIWCHICMSSSPESQEHLREIARLGLARFLGIARDAGHDLTIEQQRDIYEALLTWDPGGVPAELDWVVYEYAVRAIVYFGFSTGVENELLAAMPAWNANYYVKDSWNISEEQRIADQLKPLLRDVDEGQ